MEMAIVFLFYGLYHDQTGVPFIPKCWEHFELFKSDFLIETDGRIIFFVMSFIYGFNLQKFISFLCIFFYFLMQSCSNTLMVIFLFYTHAVNFSGAFACFF